MTTIATLDQLLASWPRIRRSWTKNGPASGAAGQWFSYWITDGCPGTGASPGNTTTGVVPTDSTAGAVTLPTVGGTQTLYLTDAQISAITVNTMICARLYDRLWHAGAFLAASLGTTNLTPTMLTRPNGLGQGTELWLEANGNAAGATTVSVSYTNSAGTSGQTASSLEDIASLNSDKLGAMHRFVLANGDYGVQSVQSITFAGATSTGSWNLVILRPICDLLLSPLVAFVNVGELDAIHTGMPQIYPNASLAWMVRNLAGTPNDIIADIGLSLSA